jgi:hypothetical protein
VQEDQLVDDRLRRQALSFFGSEKGADLIRVDPLRARAPKNGSMCRRSIER